MNEEITLRDTIKAIVVLKPGATLAIVQQMIWAKTARSTISIALHNLKDRGLFSSHKVENKFRPGFKCHAYYPTKKLLDSFHVTAAMIEYLGLEVKVKARKIKREDNTVFEFCKQSPATKRILWFYGRGDLPAI